MDVFLLKSRSASDIGVFPAYIDGMEKSGLVYFLWSGSPAVGAQCGLCNAVIWVDAFENPTLSEKKPHHVPSGGDGYNQYYNQKVQRFLESIPPCPACGGKKFDRFVNNVNFPRLEDGTVLTDVAPGLIKNVDPKGVSIWFLGKG